MMNREPTIFAAWRDSGRTPKLFIVDARAGLFVLLVMLHPRTWTLILALIIIAFASILERFQFTLPIAIRLFRGLIAGKHKYRA